MSEENKEYLNTKEHLQRSTSKNNNAKTNFKSRKFGKLTYIAGILLTVAFSLYIIFHAVITIATWVKGEPYTASEIAIATILRLLFNNIFKTEIGIGVLAFILGFVYDILIIIFSSNLIIDSKKNIKEYIKSTGPMITYLCFYAIWLVVPIIQLCNSGALIGIIYLLVVLSGIILVILDLIKARSIAKNQDVTIGEKQEERKFNAETQTSKTVDIMNELQKLVSLKDSGALTEEEFTKLKQDLLNNK
ncbi:MAG: SHOCT domain-containing protein [Christensenellales bacterium]